MTLKEAREARGLSQSKLVALTNGAISIPTISQIETGQASPREATRIVLAHALGLRPEDIEWPQSQRTK